MTTYAAPRQSARKRQITPAERLEAVREWYTKPFTPRAGIVVPAVAGAVTFALFVAVSLSA